MTQAQDDRVTFAYAKKFLIRELGRSDAEEILNSYLFVSDRSSASISIQNIYLGLLCSAQNANMKAGVIGRSLDGGVDSLGRVLFDFNPAEVAAMFGDDHDRLLDEIVAALKPRGKIYRTPKSIWPKYCRTILSAAAFMEQFRNGEDFREWANNFYTDPRSIAALPLLLAAEIDGIGYPLACNFLKEIGYTNYGKPDVHIIEIFCGIGLCQKGTNPHQIQKIIARIANAANVSSYAVDKLFWLIGSGKFDNHSGLKRTGKKKAKFITEFITSRDFAQENGH